VFTSPERERRGGEREMDREGGWAAA